MKEIKYAATCVIHWATGPVNCCDKHANGLKNLGAMLGTHVACTKLETEEECINCVNENLTPNLDT